MEDDSQISLTSFLQLKQTLFLSTGSPQVCWWPPVHFIPVCACLSHTEEPKSGPISLNDTPWELARRKDSLLPMCWLQSGIAQCLIILCCHEAACLIHVWFVQQDTWVLFCRIVTQAASCLVARVWVCPKYRTFCHFWPSCGFCWWILPACQECCRGQS